MIYTIYLLDKKFTFWKNTILRYTFILNNLDNNKNTWLMWTLTFWKRTQKVRECEF